MDHPITTDIALTPDTRPSRAKMEIVARSGSKADVKWQTVRFGDVTVTGPVPSDEEMRRNLEASRFALRGLREALLHPGIHIEPKKDVPLFWADEDNPVDGFIRQLNGKLERGVLDEDGNFQAID